MSRTDQNIESHQRETLKSLQGTAENAGLDNQVERENSAG